jgi:glutamate-1-semialdehyde aminotransferase
MPLGVYGGRADIMALATPGAMGGRWVGGGTFSSHPLTMVAGLAVLNQLEQKKDAYPKLFKMGNDFVKRLNGLLGDLNAPMICIGYGSFISVSCLNKFHEGPIVTSGQLGKLFNHHLQDMFQGYLMQEHIFGYHGLGAMSFSHSQNDLDQTLDGIRIAVESLMENMTY